MDHHFEYLELLLCLLGARKVPSHPMYRCSHMDSKQGPMHLIKTFLEPIFLTQNAKTNMLYLLDGTMDVSVWVPCMAMSDEVLLQEYFD